MLCVMFIFLLVACNIGGGVIIEQTTEPISVTTTQTATTTVRTTDKKKPTTTIIYTLPNTIKIDEEVIPFQHFSNHNTVSAIIYLMVCYLI